MDAIVTPVTVITLDSTRIVHSIKADLVARYFPPVVRLVQYDQSLPVIAVSLMQNGQTYTLPSGAAANIRVHKPDATYVYNPALGCDSTRKIVYFEVTQAMAAASGDGLAIVEIVVNGDIAGTSLITLHFEENPVPEEAIESSDEWETIYELGERIIASTVTPVSTAAGMTDHDVVYLYTGTESGWNQGHMYYYNGTTWVDAGIAVTDTTLSVAGLAADAKKTGDEIADLKDGLEQLETDLTNTINNVYATDTASGAIASFPDGAGNVPVKSLAVDIEPVQDLHGQSAPYPAGGGKNKLVFADINQTTNGVTCSSVKDADGNIIAYKFTGTATAYTAFIFGSAQSMGLINGQSYTLSDGNGRSNFQLAIWDTTSSTWAARAHGNPTSFTYDSSHTLSIQIYVDNGQATNITLYPMIRLSSVSDATFAPYSNICPISGHTQAVVYRTGKNFLKTTETTKTQNGVTFTVNSDGSVSVSGTATAFTAFVFGSAQSMGLKHGQRYTISDGDGRPTFQLAIWDATDNVWAARSHNNPNTFTYDSAHTLSLQIYVDNGQATNITLYPMIRLASDTDETFAPYQGQEVTISLNGTRYGGTLDVTTGVLTVDRVLARLGDYSVQYASSVSCFALDIGNTSTPSPTAAGLDGCISSGYKSAYTGSSPNLSNLPNNSFVVNTTAMSSAFKRIVIKDTAYTDADAFKTARADVVFVLPLATSQTIQLTANEISTVLGQNNIWADTGDVEVEYRADTKLYIQKVLNA